jgi:hypothetical protein
VKFGIRPSTVNSFWTGRSNVRSVFRDGGLAGELAKYGVASLPRE